MEECKNRMFNNYNNYIQEQYTKMENDLEDTINKLKEDTANKYFVIPLLKLLKPNVVSVWIVNKTGTIIAY
jgi:hypothetical protein